jgi:hypothetical protein
MKNKKPSYQITIPEPCKEDWNEMSPIQQGKHCTVCKKDLVDFTNMSDNSLIDFLSKKKDEKTCGRFHSSQLDRVILSSEQRDSGFLLRASAVLAMIGGAFAAVGQESDTSKVHQEGVTITKEDILNLERGNNEHIGVVIGSYAEKVIADTVQITGKITDENDDAIPFANVIFYHDEKVIGGASTDFDGYYLAHLNTSKKEITIVISHIEYEKLTINSSINDLLMHPMNNFSLDYGKIIMGDIEFLPLSKKEIRKLKRDAKKKNR